MSVLGFGVKLNVGQNSIILVQGRQIGETYLWKCVYVYF